MLTRTVYDIHPCCENRKAVGRCDSLFLLFTFYDVDFRVTQTVRILFVEIKRIEEDVCRITSVYLIMIGVRSKLYNLQELFSFIHIDGVSNNLGFISVENGM